jgi:APA family basic amino acid/polyamine antiporter
MTSVGTLLAFVLVSAGVWVMRRTHPELNRPFRTPMVPLVPILAILFSTALIIGLSPMTQLRLVVWLVIGLAIYFGYGRKHSKVQNAIANGAPIAPARSMAD